MYETSILLLSPSLRFFSDCFAQNKYAISFDKFFLNALIIASISSTERDDESLAFSTYRLRQRPI